MGYEFWKPSKGRFEGFRLSRVEAQASWKVRSRALGSFWSTSKLSASPETARVPGQAACAGYNVALYSTGLSSNPAISNPRMQAYLESGISQNELNSLRRPNEKVAMTVRSSRTHLGGGSADCLVLGFAG